MVLEDDAEFDEHWWIKHLRALANMPQDTDILYIGSCNTSDKEKTDLGNGLYRIFYPHCTHAYIVFPSALPVLLESQRLCYAPIDLAMAFRSLPRLRHVTLLPRIVGQRDTSIGA